MASLSCLCLTSQLVHKACLDAVAQNSKITGILIFGPKLTPLPYLTDPRSYAQALGVPFRLGEDLAIDEMEGLAGAADVTISLGYGKILKRRELYAPEFGTFNLHPAALPTYRGKHPDLFAVIDGQERIGITLHRMDPSIDTGPIVGQKFANVLPEDDMVSLTDRLYSEGASLIEDFLTELSTNGAVTEQDQPKYFDALQFRRIINWNDSAWRINNLVRGLTFPWPMAKTSLNGRTLLISKVRVAMDGVISPGRVLEARDDFIRVGTGGHSVDILELRGEDREIIPLSRFLTELGPGPWNYPFGGEAE